MSNRNSPLKRKHDEFHDPDYPQQALRTEEDDGQPGCSKNFRYKRRKSMDNIEAGKETQQESYLHKVRQVIEREFQREIAMKQQQLEEINERLEKAKHLLDRLRYGIVLAYYKKQEIPVAATDAASLRGSNSLIEREEKGPQLPIHPSVKKLIGKKPKDLRDVMRVCPKRTAAQNAVLTIRTKTQAQKREERKIRKIIRNHGIVIDHSKQNATDNNVNALLNAAATNSMKSTNDSAIATVKQEPPVKEYSKKPSGKSLNTSRLNNKIKHLIVVGNTSKYIGNEVEWDIKSHTKNLSYKWLVYVQSKEAKHPIERFIKKVRFHLHNSYRPNDVLDIESPPFQVSRRGWGEFPIRVQLFFHADLHQKPVQLIHNIILDQTLSGMQTLGAETLLEIWLRDVKLTNSLDTEIKDAKPEVEVMKKTETPTTLKTNIITHNELVDENLIDFLNKIEASPCSISADIERIQPTVVVNEPLGVQIKTPSPEKHKVFAPIQQKSPIKMPPLVETMRTFENSLVTTKNETINSIVSTPACSTSVPASEEFKAPIFSSGSLTAKPIMTFARFPSTSTSQVKLINSSMPVVKNISEIPPLAPITPLPALSVPPNQLLASTIKKPSIILNKDGKIVMPSASIASVVRKTILPIVTIVPTTISTTITQTSQIPPVNKPQILSVKPSSTATIINAPKQILQKRLVQLVDSTGNIKYIQMLVAAGSVSSSAQNLRTSSSVAPKLVTISPSSVQNRPVTNTTQITNTIPTPLLKGPNGSHLVPVLTSKPNIFRIVPDSMQTKPQILTFSTSVGTTNINTLSTTNTQQKLQYSVTRTAQNVGPISTASATILAKPNNTTLPVVNKLQNSNANTTTAAATKNLVFQKEGKLYIIDPQQIKYKQQQKKQISLLKPQISLLKQQQQKLNTPTAINYFGLKQQRISSMNALQLMQMKRMLFEKHFLRQEFTNIRAAVEFLLRRLRLVAFKDSLVSDFPFVSHSLQEFQSLTAFKQRAHEWLRAKNIAQLLRNHKGLQRLNSTSKELFWSTKEIAIFARHYVYTPSIKSLPRPADQQEVGENSSAGFTDLVKSELKQEHHLQYDTLTDHYKVRKWVEKVWNTLEDYEHNEDQHEIIDIDGIEEENYKANSRASVTSNSVSSNLTISSLDIYLVPPPHLENECQLVSDICKDLHIKLDYEELDTKVYHPTAQTALAQCLRLFIEKVLRQAIAFKQGISSMPPSANESICTLTPQDFAKALASSSEFDFLTNNNFGSAALCLELSMKEKEKP